jgi:flagellar biosynthetic protein FliP
MADIGKPPEPSVNLIDQTLSAFQEPTFLNLHQQLRILAFLTALSLIPFALVMMTSFTRISIVFHFLKQALGTQQVPSSQIVVGLSLLLTAYVMHPVIEEIQEQALIPYMNGEFQRYPEVKMGLRGEDGIFLEKAWTPLRHFLLRHTREADLKLFLDMGHVHLPKTDIDMEGGEAATGQAYDLKAVPWYCVIPSFVLSELRMAFMIGFLLFMPFLVIDMVVSSILMSMGMMMLPPVMISMPFKILLFILIDGWRLIIQQLINGFYPGG